MNTSQTEQLKKKLKQLEAQRTTGAKKGRWNNRVGKPFQFLFWIGIILTFGGAVLPVLFFLVPFGVVALLVSLIVPRLLTSKKDPVQAYQAAFRKDIVSWLFNERYSPLVYQEKESISLSSVKASEIFGRGDMRVEGENKVVDPKTQMACSNLIIRQEKKTTFLGDVAEGVADSVVSGVLGLSGNDIGDEGEEWMIVFRGLLVMHKLGSETQGKAIFHPKGAKWTKPFVRSYKRYGTKVETRNAELDASFDVYVSKGRNIWDLLTPEIEQYILRVHQNLSPTAAFSLGAGHVFAAVPSQKSWFDPDLQAKIGSLEDFHPYMDQLDKIWQLRWVEAAS